MTDSKNTTDTGETLPGVDVSDWPETADVTHDVPDWLIPSRVYDILKWLGLIVLPALALFVNTVGPAWAASRGRDSYHAQRARHPRRRAHRRQRHQTTPRPRRMTITHGSAPPGIADSSTSLTAAGRGRFRVVAEGFAGSISAHILPTFSVKTG